MKYLHTMVRVENIDASLDFYCNKLGLKEVRRVENEKGRFTLIFLGAENSDEKTGLLELTYNWGKKEYNKGNAYGHIALGVQNIYKVCKNLSENGCKITRPPGPMKNSTTILAFIEDPDGYKIELIEKNCGSST
mgnify:CR=1 FL=1